MNVPGVGEGNWTSRMEPDVLTPALSASLRSKVAGHRTPARVSWRVSWGG